MFEDPVIIDESGYDPQLGGYRAAWPAWKEKQALPHPGHPLIAKRMWKVPMRICINDSRVCSTVLELRFWLIAKSAADAANWARDRLEMLPETEIYAWGPKGGEVYRYVGYESAIGTGTFSKLSNEEIEERMEEVIGRKVNWKATNSLAI